MGGCGYELDGFALQPGSAVFESLQTAGFDCVLPVPGEQGRGGHDNER